MLRSVALHKRVRKSSKERMSENDFYRPTTDSKHEEALCTELINQRRMLEKGLEAYLHPILSSQCLSLCQRMQRAFPQDVRDMVYAYIIKEGVHKVEGVAKYGKATPEQSKRRPATPAHLQDVQHVGKPTLFELGRFCYQVTTFKIGGNVLEQRRRLGQALLQIPDPWQSGHRLLRIWRCNEQDASQF
jgi:hypothetical protein